MLVRAHERVAAVSAGAVRTICGDFREAPLADGAYDVVLAAAVLHHLRDDDDWETAFAKIHRILAPGGSVWITDLVAHESAAVHDLMWRRYGEYLEQLGGPDCRDKVFAYIDREDSPRPATYQLDLLRRVGFTQVELLHKNSCFAAFGAIKQA
jgi:tRNA (cmo5U34)-methyltransferase